MRVSALALLLLCPMMLFSEKTCYSPEDALAHQNKDVCIAAHVYDVVGEPMDVDSGCLQSGHA